MRLILRRELPLRSEKLEQLVNDFSRLDDLKEALAADALFCCLGTTMARAGSREAFRRVDFDLPLALAKLAIEAGTRNAVIVSALGANAHSSVFYNRVKGERENALAALQFQSLIILRPSLLLGERFGIRFARAVAFLLIGPLQKYRAIPAARVASALKSNAFRAEPGLKVLESHQIG